MSSQRRKGFQTNHEQDKFGLPRMESRSPEKQGKTHILPAQKVKEWNNASGKP